MKFIRIASHTFTAVMAIVFSMSAMAQYQWLDASGRKVFSDQPPPANIPAKRILQQPGKVAASSSSATTDDSAAKTNADIDPNDPKAQAKAAAAEAASKASDAVKKSAEKDKAKDKDLEAAKKKLDDEAAAKKKAEDDVRNAAKADNCTRAKQAKTTLDSGVRLNQINAKGERVFMDDAARMVETKRLEGIMATDCK
jgi:flagellar biosynthesis GTPase FlhF